VHVPSVYRDKPIEISRAKRAISAYSKAVGDPTGEAELMIFFVECGSKFTVEFGDIDEAFYFSLNLMYKRAIDMVLSLSVEQRGLQGAAGGDHDILYRIGWVITTHSATTFTKLSPRMNSADWRAWYSICT